MEQKRREDFFAFIQESPTAFHAVEAMSRRLRAAGFLPLAEGDCWSICPGGKYFVTRNASSIIAFAVGEQIEEYSFQMTASHSDSPAFRLKENAVVTVKNQYTLLNTEGYGGMICSSWLDRPLSLAGRVMVRQGNRLMARLFCLDEDLLLIPSLAIHLNREVNEKQSLNKQVDMRPLLAGRALEKDAVKGLVAETLGVEPGQILGMDLFLYNRDEPRVWGREKEFFSAPRLDDLACAYASLMGFLEGSHPETVGVFACLDNEEVGSGTKQGAASTFLSDVLSRVNASLGKSREDFHRALAGSLLLSCDNGHAVHPNHPEKSDETNGVYLNEGIVVKTHAGQKYTSDGVSIALFGAISEAAGVPLQHFANRSDMVGGSTLGNIAMSQVSVNAIDIGLPQLAMHSAYETAGMRDLDALLCACRAFYCSRIRAEEPGVYAIDTRLPE